jgi:hypothetical protein
MIIRADKAFFEAMQEAGFALDLATLRGIYDTAKKKRPRHETEPDSLPLFPEIAARGRE